MGPSRDVAVRYRTGMAHESVTVSDTGGHDR